MTIPATCPRCSGPVQPPGLWSSAWECSRHGAVAPFHVAPQPAREVVEHLARHADVPVWMPRPLLAGWTVSGVAHAGDERTGARASVLAFSGPCPLGGPADLVLVAEEPGLGLGARYAGRPGVEPWQSPPADRPEKVHAAGHPTPLWAVQTPADRVAFAGEAGGVWLWAVLWPAAADLVLLEDLHLVDLRHEAAGADVAFGATSPYLTAAPVQAA